jgi:hypothetical protein
MGRALRNEMRREVRRSGRSGKYSLMRKENVMLRRLERMLSVKDENKDQQQVVANSTDKFAVTEYDAVFKN